MARIIVLSFNDNESAEMFATEMLKPVEQGRPFVPPTAKIEAMIARPTSACQGSHRIPGKIRTERGFTRTRRFGWWVCATCKKPTRTIIDRFIENMLAGYNDLLPELQGGEPKEPRWIKETLTTVQQQQPGR